MARTARVSIMFTDVVGSTALLEQLGDHAGTDLLRRHFAILRRAVAAHGGREVKSLGDGLMVVFADGAGAIRCAAAMQRAITRHNRAATVPLGLRVGVHTGDVLHEAGDYYGRTVVIAKRLCDACAAGQVVVSDAVGAADTDELGPLILRGLDTPVSAAALRWDTPLTVVAPRRRAAS